MSEVFWCRVGELALLYVLVGYCGLLMLSFSLNNLIRPDQVVQSLGFPIGNPFQDFVEVTLLAMSILSLLTLRCRGNFLIGPAVCWAVFFTGATFVHLNDYGAKGGLTHGGVLAIFASHGLIEVLLTAALLASDLLKGKA